MSSALLLYAEDVLKDYGEKVNPRIFVLLHHNYLVSGGRNKMPVYIFFYLHLMELITIRRFRAK